MTAFVAMAEPAQEARILSLHAMLDSREPSDDESTSRLGDKRSFQPYHAQSVPRLENLQAQASERAGSGAPITTMMLRNIPNKYTQNSLLQEMDEQGFADSYNFFYLPMDVHNRSNVGYSFINFRLPQDAERFRQKFSDHRFQRFQSRKVSSVCAAHVQGLDQNLYHFRNRAVTHAKNCQYRPIVLMDNVRVDFEVALAEAKTRIEAAAGQVSSAAPVPQPPPGLAVGSEKAQRATQGPARPRAGTAPASTLGRDGLELAIRDLACAIKGGEHLQGRDQKLGLGVIAPPPGLLVADTPLRSRTTTASSATSHGPIDYPAYVQLPSSTAAVAFGHGRDERQLLDLEDSCGFARGISGASEASTKVAFSRSFTDDSKVSVAQFA